MQFVDTPVWGSLYASFKQVCSDPSNAGKPLHGLPKPWSGRVFRKQVGGRRGHRLIYYLYERESAVLGIYISPVTRSNFDYDDAEWQRLLEVVYQDLKDGNDGKFQTIRLP